ncbi:MAG: stage sporulation protein, partial [Clostridia bacterium]|nr:stage sporulation protein [Clostridia bacterium]
WVYAAVCSGFRGYFQGMQFMRAIAVAQVSEQVVRVISGLPLAVFLLPRGIEYAAAGLAGGMVLGEIVGLLLSLVIFFLARPYWEIVGEKVSKWEDVLPAARLAFPVALARVADCSMFTLEALMIPHLLQNAGLNAREATAAYGCYSGIALTLVQLPTIITIAVATTMVPVIAEAMAVNNLRLVHHRCSQALKLTVISSLPFAVSFYLFATELSDLIFTVPEAGIPLRVLSWGCVFLYLQHSTSGILNGLGAMKVTLKTTLISGGLIILAIYFLVPLNGIAGAAIALNLGSIAAALLNMHYINSLTKYRLDMIPIVIWPLLAAIVMAGAAYYLWTLLISLPLLWRLSVSLFLGGVVYFSILLAAGIVQWSYFAVFSWLRFKPDKWCC